MTDCIYVSGQGDGNPPDVSVGEEAEPTSLNGVGVIRDQE